AAHIPVAIDTPALWTPVPGDGYLNFMTPAAFIPVAPLPGTIPVAPLGIFTEEHTGYTTAAGVDIVDALGPPVFPAGPDNDPFAGDRADFDWVQEHRPDEVGGPGGSNHTVLGVPVIGAMGWEIAPTMASPHTSGGVAHGHSVAEAPPGALPELANIDYAFPSFTGADVFSIISGGEDTDVPAPREAALDYELWFVSIPLVGPAVSVHGVPVTVFVPGWTAATTIDDYVARWVPAPFVPPPGFIGFNAIAIDPFGAALGHNEITEIDAIKVWIPEPATLTMLALGGLAVLLRRRPA
ncbi:MAG: PEP-CTERM sorting domain-containing protein, partial [Phycisphaeraceae bacterium]